MQYTAKTGKEIVRKAKLLRLMIAIASAPNDLEQAKIRLQMKRRVK